MNAYRIRFKPSVEKDLRRLSMPVAERVMKRIAALETEPYPRGTVKLSDSEKLYRIRVGDYRVVYEVDTQVNRIIIHYVRHRREVYRT